jgi:small subunit ribosomal protein S17
MSEEEKRDVVEETADEGSSEGSDAGPAGPVGAGDPPPPAVAEASSEAVPPTPPPAGETDEAQDEAPAAESDEAPAAEQGDSSSEEDELPWKERRRLQRSRLPHVPRPQQTPEERKAARAEARKAKATLRRTQRAAAKKEKRAGMGTPAAEPTPNAAKVRQGIVVSDKADKSITVRIDIARRHPTYEKIVRQSRTLHAHDERNEAGEGDTVRVVETRPLSKTKRWRLVEVLEKAK